MDVVCLKLGGSVITYKFVNYFPLRLDEIRKHAIEYIRIKEIDRIVKNEILPFLNENKVNLILGLGVGPFGHHLSKIWKELDNIKTLHESIKIFSNLVKGKLEDVGLDCEILFPFDYCRISNGKIHIENLVKNVKMKLKDDKVPIIPGDIVPSDSGKYGDYDGLSADISLCDVAIALKAKAVIMATDVDGFYDKDPKQHGDAKLIGNVDMNSIINESDEGEGIDVSGRVPSKVINLQRVAKSGIKGKIVNGFKEGYLKRALSCEDVGSIIQSTTV